jgi:hypothetical protein
VKRVKPACPRLAGVPVRGASGLDHYYGFSRGVVRVGDSW